MSQHRVFDYIDYRAFLRNWFAARKSEDPSYSYAVFARANARQRALRTVPQGGVDDE